jgi:hypothetical protein
MPRNRLVLFVSAAALALTLSACAPSTPPLPPTPSVATEDGVTDTTDQEYEISERAIGAQLNTRGIEATDAQKTAYWDSILNSADINTRMVNESLPEPFIWNLGYIGAAAPDSAVTAEVRGADLSGASTEKNRLDGLYDSEFSKWVAEESGVSQDAMYFVVVLHAAQLGITHFRS